MHHIQLFLMEIRILLILFKMFMKKQKIIIANWCLFLSLVSCNQSIQNSAKLAARQFCDCIQENLFVYRTSHELYSHCNTELEKKYRLASIYFKMVSIDGYLDSVSKSTKDSVNTFNYYFLKFSDSCHSLPEKSLHQF